MSRINAHMTHRTQSFFPHTNRSVSRPVSSCPWSTEEKRMTFSTWQQLARTF